MDVPTRDLIPPTSSNEVCALC